MGLVERLDNIITGFAATAAPLAARVAPFAIGGVGGFVASRVLDQIGANAAAANVQSTQRQAAQALQANCPPSGVVGTPFNSTFQSGTFSSGGALPGRQAHMFIPSAVVGRQMLPNGCPKPPGCACPSQAPAAAPQPMVSANPVATAQTFAQRNAQTQALAANRFAAGPIAPAPQTFAQQTAANRAITANRFMTAADIDAAREFFA